jgi:transposase
MNWPPQSPDLNIIENVWRILKIRLQTRVTRIHNRQELIDAVQEIWQSLTPMYIKSLYSSLPRRIRAVLVANGCITKY